ncbi:MAG: hypothetical protein ACFWUL_00770 [Dialister sp.]|jgi:hypothetical protein
MVVAARKLDIADLCVFIAAPPLDLNSQISNLKSQIFHMSSRPDASHRLLSLMI